MSALDKIALIALDGMVLLVSFASLSIMLMGVRRLRGKQSWLDRFLFSEHH